MNRFLSSMLSRLVALVALLCSLGARGDGPLRIGAEDDWYPYSAQHGGKPVGMAAELVVAAYRAEGIEVQLISLPYARCMQLALADKLIGCFDTLRNPQLEHKYRWARTPLVHARIDIYAPASAPNIPVSYDMLHGKRIAVTNGYEYGQPFDDDKTMLRDIGDSDLFALKKLASGRVDYALVYDRIVAAALEEHPELKGTFKSVGTLIEPDIYISFAPHLVGVDDAIRQFDAGMAKIKANGELQKIYTRWH